jgi:lysozyme
LSFYSDLKAILERHEGRKAKPYVDTVGKVTIGVGRNLTDRGLSEKEIDVLLENDIELCRSSLQYVFPNFDTFSDKRRLALFSLMFNLGVNRFQGFEKMIHAIKDEDWHLAAFELIDSKYHSQVPNRAEEISNMLIEG